jgi:hypothetical protein
MDADGTLELIHSWVMLPISGEEIYDYLNANSG